MPGIGWLPEVERDPHLRAYLGHGHLLICAPTYEGCLQPQKNPALSLVTGRDRMMDPE